MHIWGSAPWRSPRTPLHCVLGELRCLCEHFYGGCCGPDLASVTGPCPRSHLRVPAQPWHFLCAPCSWKPAAPNEPQILHANRAGRGMWLSAFVAACAALGQRLGVPCCPLLSTAAVTFCSGGRALR